VGKQEAEELAGWMCDVIDAKGDPSVIARVKGQVLDLCGRHPVYQ
jgi:glycine hydroxymethyltransferase